MKATLIAVVAALALFGCGSVGSGAAPSPSPSPSTGLGIGFDVAVSERTKAITVKVGQKVEAVLHANPGQATWSGIKSSDPSVLVPIVNPAATAVRGVSLAGFKAIAPGKAQINATAVALCSPGRACPQYAVLLSIDVTVVPGT